MLTADAVAFVAEQKIQEALKEGVFDNLPGAGKPLVQEDLSHLPPEMRMAYTILKNSGYTGKPEMPVSNVETDSVKPEAKTRSRLLRLDVLLRRVRRARGQDEDMPPLLDELYLDKILKRL